MRVTWKRLLVAMLLVAVPVVLGWLAHKRRQAYIEAEIRVLMGDDVQAAEAARQRVQRMGKPAVKPLIRELHNTPTGEVEDRLARALANIGDPRAPRALFHAAREGSVVAAECLATLRHPRAREALGLARYAEGNRAIETALQTIQPARSLPEAQFAWRAASDRGWAPSPVATMSYGLSCYWDAYCEGGCEPAREALMTALAAAGSGDLRRDADYWGWTDADGSLDDKILATKRQELRRLSRAVQRLVPPDPYAWWAWEAIPIPQAIDGRQLWVAAAAAREKTLFTHRLGAVLVAEDEAGLTAQSWVELADHTRLEMVWLGCEDIDHDGAQEVLLQAEVSKNADLPYQFAVLEVSEGAVGVALRLSSAYPVVVTDLDERGAAEVVGVEILSTRHRVAGPAADWESLWLHVYAWRNGRWQEGNGDFPQVWRYAVADLEAARGHAPRDPNLLVYLGEAYCIAGQDEKAVAVWRQAERICRGRARAYPPHLRPQAEETRLADEIAKRREQLEGNLHGGDGASPGRE